MKKTICCLALACGMLAGSAGAWYYDLPSDWARDEVRAAEDSALVPNELTVGYSLGMPFYITKDGGLTRYAFSEMLGRMLALSHRTDAGTLAAQQREAGKTVSFTDYTPSDAVYLACAYGLVEGTPNGAFQPGGALTREQAAKILSLAAEAVRPGSYKASGSNGLADQEEISPWAREYVGYALQSGLMKGVGEGRFDPQGGLTVEQGTVLVYRLAQTLGLDGVVEAGVNNWMWEYGVDRTYFASLADAYGVCYTGNKECRIERVEVTEAEVNGLPASVAPADGYQLPGAFNLGAALVHEPLKIGKMYGFTLRLRLYPADGGEPVEVTDRFTYLCGKYCTYPDDNYY